MATLLLDQWIATNGPLPPISFGSGVPADNNQAMASAAFRYRVSMAATAAAVAISAEALTVTDHVNRAALAKLVMQSPATWMLPFAQALASQGLDGNSTDAAINSGVASVWNALSG